MTSHIPDIQFNTFVSRVEASAQLLSKGGACVTRSILATQERGSRKALLLLGGWLHQFEEAFHARRVVKLIYQLAH